MNNPDVFERVDLEKLNLPLLHLELLPESSKVIMHDRDSAQSTKHSSNNYHVRNFYKRNSLIISYHIKSD
jgi:hypothetical protein